MSPGRIHRMLKMKRKALQDNERVERGLEESSSAESSSDDEIDMLDVEFEWFDPQPEHDFHGIKTLLRQLLDVDSQLFDVSALADLILSQPLLGSTVKVDGNETDPYAFLTVLSIHEHREKPPFKKLVDYLVRQTEDCVSFSQLRELLRANSTARIGLLLTERLINIPGEVSPPMYKMLLEEISWAVEEKEPFKFSHYLIISKKYQEVASDLTSETSTSQKKKKQKTTMAGQQNSTDFYFHPEDEILQRHAIASGEFDYVNQQGEGHPDSKRAFQDFGIRPRGSLILLEAKEFEPAVKAVEGFYSQGQL